MSNRAVIVTAGKAKYGHDVAIGPHLLHVDEPQSAGGRDAGPTLYELLLAALGTCTAITRTTASSAKQQRHGWIESTCRFHSTGISRMNNGAACSPSPLVARFTTR
jgi:uncharacterized OsmC-like protein